MRLRLLVLVLVATLSACGGGADAAPPAVDGVWSAYADGLGGTLTLRLNSKGTSVSGSGTYTVGAMRSGTLAVTGSIQTPAVALVLTYDHGERAALSATLSGSERMVGRLTYSTGSSIDIEFVRP